MVVSLRIGVVVCVLVLRHGVLGGVVARSLLLALLLEVRDVLEVSLFGF
jgi:hypothetical protein